MKKTFLTLISLCFLVTFLFAQERDTPVSVHSQHNHYHEFEDGEETYLIADRVNVRSEPSSKAKVVDNIPIGTKITVLKNSYKTLTLKGFTANWYKIQYGRKTGYVWGGLIAEGSVKGIKANSVRFLYGVKAYATKKTEYGYEEEVVTIQVRVCKDNEELSQVEFDAVGGLSIAHWITAFGNLGLSDIKEVLEINVSQQMCAGTNANYVLFWDGQKIHYVKELRPGGDVPYFYSDDLIFPVHKGGEKGKIFGEQISGEYGEEEGAEDIIESHKKVEYKWTGTKLVQTKVLIDKQ